VRSPCTVGVRKEAVAAPRHYTVLIADDDDLLKRRLRVFRGLGNVERKGHLVLGENLSHNSHGSAEEGCEHLDWVQSIKNRG